MDIQILIIVVIDYKWGNYSKASILSATIKEYIYPNSNQRIRAKQVDSVYKTRFWHRWM